MRMFNVCFSRRNRIVAYQDLEGEKAIKVMKDLNNKGFNCWAITKTFETEHNSNVWETLTLSEMEKIYDFSG